MNPIVKKYLQKTLFNQKGAIASSKSVKFAYDALETRMKNLGLDINLIKSEKDLNQALGFVKTIEDQVFQKKFGDVLNKKESADVFDLKGKKLDPNEPIMGGTQTEDDILQKSIDKNIKEATEKGDFVGIKNQLLRDPEILKEFKKMKEAEALADERALQTKPIPLDTIQYQGKEIQKMSGPEKQKYLITDDDQTAELLKRGYTFDDIIYAQDNYGLTAKEIMEEAKGATKKDPFPFASGGRAGFKVGSPSKRAFLKAMGGIAATIAAIKSGLIGKSGKEVGKQVVKETATDVAKAPPSYFFDLANKIKLLGKESKVKPKERTNEYYYTGKDGSEYTLTEDMGTGEMQIVKEKGGMGIADDKAYDTIDDRTVMEYRPGKSMADEGTKGTPADEYDEYKVEFDRDGTPADADEISEIVKKEIIQESKYPIRQKLKKASGGVAHMLGE